MDEVAGLSSKTENSPAGLWVWHLRFPGGLSMKRPVSEEVVPLRDTGTSFPEAHWAGCQG